ncbi:MAG TPA: glycosyltransferase family 9 protein, partial [Nitrospira sp.]|nr:glycosyltransferase family 9 protein [Nitrospira sp.]
LGDLLCTVPAFRALRSAFPEAVISLIGLPWAKSFVERFHHYLDEFIEFPGYPGLPEQEVHFPRLRVFLDYMRRRQFDWLIQLQGDGSYVNDLIRSCGARDLWGFAPDPANGVAPGFMPYPTDCPEIHRHLRLMEFMGASSKDDHLEFPFTAGDQMDFDRLPNSALLAQSDFACLHPGGKGLRRRWKLENFIDVARGLGERGLRVVVTGVADEEPLAAELGSALTDPPINMTGRTTLGSLGILLSRARLLVANDTGVSHVAAALRTPSVILSVGSDPARWNPLDAARHRVLQGSAADPQDVLAEADDLLCGLPRVEPSRLSQPPRPLRILTWHVHGNYLYYLSHTSHEWYLPVGLSRPGYSGRAPGFPWPDRVRDVPIQRLKKMDFDGILFQSKSAYLEDQYELLTHEQRRLPRLYLEHDPPDDPTESRHIVDDPAMHLIHVTQFNRVMWDNGATPTSVIEHGVPDPQGIRYTGELPRGLVVVNDLPRRGRRAGADLVERIRGVIPLDLIGMNSEAAGGLGEISHEALPAFMSRYRFFFHSVRYTSFGLAVCEAMMIGLPVVALPVTEMPAVLRDGVSGYLDANVDRLMQRMAALLANPEEARRLGDEARAIARRRFNLDRFTADWHRTLSRCIPVAPSPSTQGVPCAAKLR